MKRLNFKSKIVVLTGASNGIGKAIAKELITKYNCMVFAIARNEQRLNEAQAELGEGYIPYPFDVSERESWQSFAEFLENRALRVDILINCAGILPEFSTVEGTEISTFEAAFAVNFFAQLYACKIISPYINDLGAIVNISSAAALCPFGQTGAYSASKAASKQLSECLSAELKHIRVSTVLPGFVRTDIMKNQTMSEKEAGLIRKFSADAAKTAKKILRRVHLRKRRIVVGFDAHLMSFMYRVFPRTAPRLISWFLKKSGLNMFK